MTDDELISYCRAHAKTERALFKGEQINRMFALAGYSEGSWQRMAPDDWVPMKTAMLELVGKALDIREHGDRYKTVKVPNVPQFVGRTPARRLRDTPLRLVVDNTKGN